MKNIKRPSTVISPIPASMISCGSDPEEYNIITIAWTGTISSSPPMCYVSIRPERHSHGIIKKNKEFVINLTNKKLTRAMDWCGTNSGRDFNKFEEMNLTPGKAQKVNAPIITESPVNIECVVKDIISLGSHDMFIAEVVTVTIDENFDKTDLVSYNNGEYYNLGEYLGYYGYAKK